MNVQAEVVEKAESLVKVMPWHPSIGSRDSDISIQEYVMNDR